MSDSRTVSAFDKLLIEHKFYNRFYIRHNSLSNCGSLSSEFYTATDSVRCLFYISSSFFIGLYTRMFIFLKRFNLSFGRHPAIIFVRRQFCFYMSSHFTTCQRTSGQYMLLSRHWSSEISFLCTKILKTSNSLHIRTSCCLILFPCFMVDVSWSWASSFCTNERL